jgi:hypothetical protein
MLTYHFLEGEGAQFKPKQGAKKKIGGDLGWRAVWVDPYPTLICSLTM